MWMLLRTAVVLFAAQATVGADGVAKLPLQPEDVHYEGTLEERAQEAILIFTDGTADRSAREHLILKIEVAGPAVDHFAWIIPFPAEPEIHKASAELFEELYRYVQLQRDRLRRLQAKEHKPASGVAPEDAPAVEVLQQRVVGSYDTAVVRETKPGALNQWLADNGYEGIENGEDVIDFYRQHGYVFACIKVSDAALGAGGPADLHPLRFTFETGGRDGIYYPMKMTGLQSQPFDVNLYVFRGSWLNDDLNQYGHVHRGFELNYRDWDTRRCKPNAGKTWSNPAGDPLLAEYAQHLSTVAKLFQSLHPGGRYYLTNLQAFDLQPHHVRGWSDDLWLFPHYREPAMVPFDVRVGGVAAAGWPDPPTDAQAAERVAAARAARTRNRVLPWAIGLLALGAACTIAAILHLRRRKRSQAQAT